MSHVSEHSVASLVLGANGLRADFSGHWAALHLGVAVAREKLHNAQNMPGKTEDDRRTKHHAVMAAYRIVEKAENALLGAV